VLAAEHLLRLARLDLSTELVERARQIVENRLAGLHPFDEHGEILDAPLQRVAQIAVVFQSSSPLEEFLRGGLVLPEVGIADALLYAGELVCGARGVKDSSADRTRAWRDPDTGGAVRRVGWRAWLRACGSGLMLSQAFHRP
jgi:hypothetical protein